MRMGTLIFIIVACDIVSIDFSIEHMGIGSHTSQIVLFIL